MKYNVAQYNTQQLQQIDQAIEAMLFKQGSTGEPFADSYKKNPKQFRKLISLMVSYKTDVMRLFKDQYLNRYRLIHPLTIRADEYDDMLNDEEWQIYQMQLAQILEEQNSNAYNLGVEVLLFALGLTIADHLSTDQQKQITTHAMKMAGDITTTTQNRVKKAIAAAMDLGENRDAFDQRLKDIFVNPYRGRFIAQQEALTAYIQGKDGLANAMGLQYKTWIGPQAIDKICSDANGKTVPINQAFPNGLMQPLAHFGCRCDITYSNSPTENN